MRLYIVAVIGVAIGWFGHKWQDEIFGAAERAGKWVRKAWLGLRLLRDFLAPAAIPLPPAALPLVVLQRRGEKWYCAGCSKEYTRNYHTLRGCQAAQKKAAKSLRAQVEKMGMENAKSLGASAGIPLAAAPHSSEYACAKCKHDIERGAEFFVNGLARHVMCLTELEAETFSAKKGLTLIEAEKAKA